MRFTTFCTTGLLLLSSLTSQADTLLDLYQAAQQNDPVLKAAEAKLRSELESSKDVQGYLLPQIGLTHSYSERDHTLDSDNILLDAGQEYTLKGTTTVISISQTLLNFTQWYAYKGGQSYSEQAEAEFANTEEDLIARTTSAYLNVLRAHDNLASSYAEESAIKHQLDQTRQRFDVGLVAITDVHESQAAYDLAKVARLANEGALETAYEALTVLTGQRYTGLATLAEDMPVTPPAPTERQAWVDMAETNNLQLKQARKAVDTAEYKAKATKAGHYPTLTASYNREVRVGTQDYPNNLSYNADVDEELTETVAITLQMPLYSGGRVSAARRQAYADYDQARESLTGAERTIIQQTRALHIAVLTQIQQVAARKQAITSAQSALEAIEAGYNVGTRNIVDVLNAQKLLYQAHRDYANARYDYIEALFDLKKAGGVLTPADIEALNQWMVPERPATQETAHNSLQKS